MRSGESDVPQFAFFQQTTLAPGVIRNYLEQGRRWLKSGNVGICRGRKANLRGSHGAAMRRKGEA